MNKSNNATEDLKELFGCRYPKAIEVATMFLNITNETVLNRKIVNNEIGFTVFKISDSYKAPYLVDVQDLAKWIDKQRQKATQK